MKDIIYKVIKEVTLGTSTPTKIKLNVGERLKFVSKDRESNIYSFHNPFEFGGSFLYFSGDFDEYFENVLTKPEQSQEKVEQILEIDDLVIDLKSLTIISPIMNKDGKYLFNVYIKRVGSLCIDIFGDKTEEVRMKLISKWKNYINNKNR